MRKRKTGKGRQPINLCRILSSDHLECSVPHSQPS